MDSIANFGLKVVAAIIILIVGLWFAKKVKALFATALIKKEVDATLIGFFSSMLYGAIVVFVYLLPSPR